MKLLTAEIIKKLERKPLYSTDGQKQAEVLVKFFTPWSNWTWYAVEGTKHENGDWEFFGLVDGLEMELGYFFLSELQKLQGPGGLRVERDRYFQGTLYKEENEVKS
jgi:hypothetical protein